MSIDPAARTALGSPAVSVPRLGMGAGTLSGAGGPAALAGALAAGLRHGLNHIDTAPLYAGGGSERIIGEFLSGRRGQAVLSTKAGRLPDAPGGGSGPRRRFDYSRPGTLESVAASLTRLRTGYLDAVIIHDVDTGLHPDFAAAYRSAVGECYPALLELKRSGVIGAIGLSTRQPDIARRALRDTDLDLLMMAGAYTLLNHAPLAGLFPETRRRGVPVLIASPFNSGILATGDPGGPFDYGPAGPAVARRLGALAEAARRHGVPLASAALQFPLAHPAVASVVAGHRSAAELERNAAGLRAAIPAGFWQELRDRRLIPTDAPVPADAPAASIPAGPGAPGSPEPGRRETVPDAL